jgi:F0F1-type ATP synthase assembly protein I
MNTRLAAASGVGLVVGTLVGILIDARFGTRGVGLVLGGAIGVSLGAAVAIAMGGNSDDGE